MANQLVGFSPEAFEQFIRALALCVFGPGVTAFGNGPDGGREASFNGKVPFPYPPSTTWSGYWVIQAKCKERPESSANDQVWAIRQLKRELETFVGSSKRSQKPEYYVFSTNVDLSSVDGGGKDKCDRLIRSYYRKLPLKGHAIWDGNQLIAFLSIYQELRKRFAAYLTPGDVIFEMLTKIREQRPDPTLILTAFLERELRADEASRLDQAGNRTEEQLKLAKLFFDLPASPEPQIVPPEEKLDSRNRLPHGVLWDLLRDGSRKLDPKALYDQEMSRPEDMKELFSTRYVLLGGPGSGKSTVGQFLAQIHRSSLLDRRPPELLETQTRQIINETRAFCDSESLPWPATPRFPFRVELNRFAKALMPGSREHVENLDSYLLKQLRREYSMTNEDLMKWLADYPWLLILDGLDEVPSSSNRSDLVKAVNDFVANARHVGADLFIVATSREHGYSGEFATETVAFRHILPLSPVRALKYVQKYADVRFGATDPNKAKDIVSKLSESAKSDLTVQLMVSPLQVTFMATVVAARGDPGEDRWQLFDSYYRTIYDRERQKAVPPYDSILRKQQVTIDRLHHDTGFWLQYQGATTKDSAVNLTIATFKNLVDLCLTEIGHQGKEKQRLVELITEAASLRLVFLTSRISGELSFDVRSLQEYMAAECIMTGDQGIVTSRLKAIAPSSYWRNVFLFAVSKCFADARSRYLQDTIRSICEDINNSPEPMLRAIKAGSELAIDILQSGAVAENPNHARHLARIGLELASNLYLPRNIKGHGSGEGPSADVRLASVYSNVLETVYRSGLELRIGQTDTNLALGALLLLARLIDRKVGWATKLMKKWYPTDVIKLWPVISLLMPSDSPWLRARIKELVPRLSPSITNKLWEMLATNEVRLPFNVGEPMYSLSEGVVRVPFKFSSETSNGITFLFMSTQRPSKMDASNAIVGMYHWHFGWLPYILANKFLSTTDTDTLAQVLDDCADGGWSPSDKADMFSLPWVLASCLDIARSGQELHTIANHIRAGHLGSAADWMAAEQRWISQGVSWGDFGESSKDGLPFDKEIRYHGLVPYSESEMTLKVYSAQLIRKLANVAQKSISHGELDHLLFFLCLAGVESGGIAKYVIPSTLREVMQLVSSTNMIWRTNCVEFPSDPENVEKWLEFFDWFGRSDNLNTAWPDDTFSRPNRGRSFNSIWCTKFQEEFVRALHKGLPGKAGRSSKIGLLRLLGRLASQGHVIETVPTELLKLDLFAAPRYKLAALIVQLTQSSLTENDAKDLAQKAISLLSPEAETGAVGLLFQTAELHLERVPSIVHFLLELHRLMPTPVSLGSANCERVLRQVARKQPCDMQYPEKIRELHLPLIGK